MDFNKFAKKLMKVRLKARRKKYIHHVTSKLIIGLGIAATIGILVSPESVKKLFKDLKVKDIPKPDCLSKVIKETVDTINNSKDNIVNKASEVKEDATNLINSINDATNEVKQDTIKTTEVISNEVDTLTCPIKEIISD